MARWVPNQLFLILFPVNLIWLRTIMLTCWICKLSFLLDFVDHFIVVLPEKLNVISKLLDNEFQIIFSHFGILF